MSASRHQVVGVVVAASPRAEPGLWLLERLEFGLFLAWLRVWLFAEIQAQWNQHLENQTRARSLLLLLEVESQRR